MNVFHAPAGYLLTEGLASALGRRGQPALWLRIDRDDNDPATLLLDLIVGAQRLSAGAGELTLELMRRRPGPIYGWRPLFAHLAAELSEQLLPTSALVIEHAHVLSGSPNTLQLLCTQLLDALSPGLTRILTASQPLQPKLLSPTVVSHSRSVLCVSDHMAFQLAEQIGTGLQPATIRRALNIAQRQAIPFVAFCLTSAQFDEPLARAIAARAADSGDLMVRIARAWLANGDRNTVDAVALALQLEYCNPDLITLATGSRIGSHMPWFQPLADGWYYMQAAWQLILPLALPFRRPLPSAMLARVADLLGQQGAEARAIHYNLALGRYAVAAELITSIADQMLDLGQWATLSTWIDQLSEETLHAWPHLLYIRGEIAAGEGHLRRAQSSFAASTQLLMARDDSAGASLSLLAEGALASRQGDVDRAWEAAWLAGEIAARTGLTWHQGWALWQLGCLTAAADAVDDALAYFGRALEAALISHDELLAELLQLVDAQLRTQRDLREQRELYRQLYINADLAEQEMAEQIRQLFSAPLSAIDVGRIRYRLSSSPLLLAAAPPSDVTVAAGQRTIWDLLAGMFRLQRQPVAMAAAAPAPEPALERAVGAPLPIGSVAIALPADIGRAVEPPACRDGAGGDGPAIARRVLHISMLGQFKVQIDDAQLDSWPSGRGRAVFKYLVMNRQAPVSRDLLMDRFWPDAAPEAARNSLNVAIYGLRQAFQGLIDLPVVIYLRREAAYTLNEELSIWLDVEEFERQIEVGRQLEAAGQFAMATTRYETALSLYQGDFLAEDLYEEWTVIDRERQRLAYLDLLDRLGQLYMTQGKYASCVSLCQQILARDNCREDAHCRLMRCYSRQNQRHMALRQYKLCAQVLAAELGVEPNRSTVQLYECILHHENV